MYFIIDVIVDKDQNHIYLQCYVSNFDLNKTMNKYVFFAFHLLILREMYYSILNLHDDIIEWLIGLRQQWLKKMDIIILRLTDVNKIIGMVGCIRCHINSCGVKAIVLLAYEKFQSHLMKHYFGNPELIMCCYSTTMSTIGHNTLYRILNSFWRPFIVI